MQTHQHQLRPVFHIFIHSQIQASAIGLPIRTVQNRNPLAALGIIIARQALAGREIRKQIDPGWRQFSPNACQRETGSRVFLIDLISLCLAGQLQRDADGTARAQRFWLVFQIVPFSSGMQKQVMLPSSLNITSSIHPSSFSSSGTSSTARTL